MKCKKYFIPFQTSTMMDDECCTWRQAHKEQSLLGLCPNFPKETELSWPVLLLLLITLILVIVPCTYFVLRREYRRAKALKQKRKTSAIIAAHEAAKKEITKPEEPMKVATVTPTSHSCENHCTGARQRNSSHDPADAHADSDTIVREMGL